MLGDERWERPEHDDRNSIKRISIVMLALQAFLLCAMGLRDKPPARRRRVFASFLTSKMKAMPRRAAERMCVGKKNSVVEKKLHYF